MSTPLSATARIIAPYTVDGLLHKLSVYVRNATPVGSTYNINTRATDSNDLDWQDASTGLAATMSLALGSTVSFGDHILELLTGSVWNPVGFHSVSNTSGTSGFNKAAQTTLVMRDVLFKKVKFIVLEGLFAGPLHFASFPISDTGVNNYVKQFTSSHTVTNPPYEWVVGRGDQYLNVAPFVGLTIALNRKARRNRGLA